MTRLNQQKLKKMKEHFDGVLDPFGVITRPNNRREMDIKRAVKWYEDASNRYAHGLMGSLEGKHVLDIGCGIGAHLIWLARNGATVTGIDLSDRRIETAKKIIRKEKLQDRISVYVSDVENTGFSGERFDIIYGQDILMFLEGKFEPFIKEMKRILKKGGHLYFRKPLKDTPLPGATGNIWRRASGRILPITSG